MANSEPLIPSSRTLRTSYHTLTERLDLSWATWAAAEFSKCELEGYSLDMPIASISVVGDKWELWATYPEGSGEEMPEDAHYGLCVLMGPVRIGDTLGMRGVFEILERSGFSVKLCCCGRFCHLLYALAE